MEDMAQEQGGKLPGGMGGLISYYDEYDEPLQFDPKIILGFIGSVIMLELALHAFRPL